MRAEILRCTSLCLLAAGCAGDPAAPLPVARGGEATAASTAPSTTDTSTVTGHLIAAGDIAGCGFAGDDSTGRLLDMYSGTILALGDNVYESGTYTEFTRCYKPTWGRHRSRTRPVPGNHEYQTPGATGYYTYFDSRAGPAGKGYYSFHYGRWHIVALNSNISVSRTSTQIQWLKQDLAANRRKCTLVMWHHPRFSSGRHGNNSSMQPIWEVLHAADADVVLNAHDHAYERFGPQTPTGAPDATRGIRQFVVGTGGSGLRAFETIRANSDFRYNRSQGVLRLTLTRTGYSWAFITIANTVVDEGTGSCH